VPDRALAKAVVRADTVAFRWRSFLERHAERREARRRERAEAIQKGYRPSRHHLLETGLLMAVITIACILSVSLLGSVLTDLFRTVGSRL
jgi:hypothetical protein